MTADGGYEIQGTNMTMVPLTYSDLLESYSPGYAAQICNMSPNTTPDYNASCNRGYKSVYAEFTAKLDRDGNVMGYTKSESLSSVPEMSSGINRGNDLGISLKFNREDRQKYNIGTGTGLIPVPYAVKTNPDGSVVWKTRINLYDYDGLAEKLGSLKFDQIVATSDNGYVILASVDKNFV
jgi:hypothetical protein